MQLSIRYKFLLSTTALLATCVGGYLYLASTEFKQDKKQLVFDYNLSLVSNISSDLESFFTGLSDKIQIIAFYASERGHERQRKIHEFLQNQNELVWVGSSELFKNVDHELYTNTNYLKAYGLEDSFIHSQLILQKPIPLEQIQMRGQSIWNATVPNGPPLVGIGRSVIEEDARGVPIKQYAVFALVRVDRIIKSLEQGQPNEVFIVNQHGETLIHTKLENMSGDAIGSPLVAIAKENISRKMVVEFKQNNERLLGAYSKAMGGEIHVLSQISEKQAFGAVRRVIFRSLLIASILLTIAFLLAIFFSRSITEPIDTLVQGMEHVAQGDLSTQIQVQSKDEIKTLADSFNLMIADLKKSRQELEDINKELENKVKERTLQLEKQNQAVKDAQEALLRTTRLAAVGEVAGQAAHEVLNPLTTIISRINKIKERISQNRQQELQLLVDIQQGWLKDYNEGGFQKLIQVWQKTSQVSAHKTLWLEDQENISHVITSYKNELNQLIEDTELLLSVSERIGRIISSFRHLSHSKGELQACHINDLCRKSVQIMADLAEKDSIKIEFISQSNQDLCLVDPDEFIQVMTNLIRNGLQSVKQKHATQFTGQVIIRTEAKGTQFEVHVTDNGLGIKKEFQSKLFEKNFTTKSKSEGTGIGLSISRRLIRSFHGDIHLLSSNEGQGAHFLIKLPTHNQHNQNGVAA